MPQTPFETRGIRFTSTSPTPIIGSSSSGRPQLDTVHDFETARIRSSGIPVAPDEFFPLNGRRNPCGLHERAAEVALLSLWYCPRCDCPRGPTRYLLPVRACEVATMEEAERARQAVNRTMVDGQLILVFIVAPPSLT
jgi:hypothetical protein